MDTSEYQQTVYFIQITADFKVVVQHNMLENAFLALFM